MSFEMKWTIVAGILCIILAYLWGLHVGYDKGCHDGRMEYVKKLLNAKYGIKAKLNSVYGKMAKEDKDAEF